MSTGFVEGDILLYFNSEVVYVVLLDEITEDYFTVVTSQDEKYQYGVRIRIRNLTEKWFMKLDQKFLITTGRWEIYSHEVYYCEMHPPSSLRSHLTFVTY